MKAHAAALLVISALAGCSKKPAANAKSTTPAPDPVRILMFYANPETPAVDETTLLCYGVDNATAVRLEPPIEHLWPTPTRCFEIPTRAATYTLIAESGSDRATRSLTIKPVPPRVHILEVSINKLDFAPGEQATICYKTRNAVEVSLKPGHWVQRGNNFGCAQDNPTQTTTYTVVATGAGGDTDSEHVSARVKQ